jgi:hypothetical protein
VLSERDARVLHRIEQQLAADDPKFAARMSRGLPGRPLRRPRDVQSPVVVAILLSVVVCLVVGVVGIGLAAVLLAAPWSGSGDPWAADQCCTGGGGGGDPADLGSDAVVDESYGACRLPPSREHRNTVRPSAGASDRCDTAGRSGDAAGGTPSARARASATIRVRPIVR